jgi:hypothetical protein
LSAVRKKFIGALATKRWYIHLSWWLIIAVKANGPNHLWQMTTEDWSVSFFML